jgi:hypothetical protein
MSPIQIPPKKGDFLKKLKLQELNTQEAIYLYHDCYKTALPKNLEKKVMSQLQKQRFGSQTHVKEKIREIQQYNKRIVN